MRIGHISCVRTWNENIHCLAPVRYVNGQGNSTCGWLVLFVSLPLSLADHLNRFMDQADNIPAVEMRFGAGVWQGNGKWKPGIGFRHAWLIRNFRKTNITSTQENSIKCFFERCLCASASPILKRNFAWNSHGKLNRYRVHWVQIPW